MIELDWILLNLDKSGSKISPGDEPFRFFGSQNFMGRSYDNERNRPQLINMAFKPHDREHVPQRRSAQDL